MINKDLDLLRGELEDEFNRWMDRLPSYINGSDDNYIGAHECLNKFFITANSIAQKHILRSQNRMPE